jgi:hypothetical protein
MRSSPGAHRRYCRRNLEHVAQKRSPLGVERRRWFHAAWGLEHALGQGEGLGQETKASRSLHEFVGSGGDLGWCFGCWYRLLGIGRLIIFITTVVDVGFEIDVTLRKALGRACHGAVTIDRDANRSKSCSV